MESHIALAIVISALIPMGFIPYLIAQTETSTAVSGSFANVRTVQDDESIVITITRAGIAEGEPVVVPPNATEDGTGVVVVPLPSNDTATEGNVTENEVIIIEPDGNITEVQDGNVTNIDNSTVVVAPENQSITETDGGVVVVDPPVCACPPVDEIEEPAPIEQPTNDTTTATEPTDDNVTSTFPILPSVNGNDTDSSNDTAAEVSNGTSTGLEASFLRGAPYGLW